MNRPFEYISNAVKKYIKKRKNKVIADTMTSQTASQTALQTASQTSSQTAPQTSSQTVLQTVPQTAPQTASQTSSQTAPQTFDYYPPFIYIPIKEHVEFRTLKTGFFVDSSGSTQNHFYDKISILDVEKQFVRHMLPNMIYTSKFVSWNNSARIVDSLECVYPSDGTDPSSIFEKTNTLNIVKESETMVIITDGQIEVSQINSFGEAMTKNGTHLKAVIGVIVGRRNTIKPCEVNVSVLLPAMISNACILFYNWKSVYVLWASGSFKESLNPIEITQEVQWDNVTTTTFSDISAIRIGINEYISLQNISDFIPLGSGVFFNPINLLLAEPSWDQLMEYPFHRICLYFRVINKCHVLLDWFKMQQDRFINEFMINDQTKDNMNIIMNKINDRTQDDINLATFRYNRNQGVIRRYINDNEIEDLIYDPRMVKLIQFFRTITNIMYEDFQTQTVSSSYTTSTITFSRYDVIYHMNTSVSSITTGFHEPFKWLKQFNKIFPDNGLKIFTCTICYESDVPFIIIRKPFDNESFDCPTSYYYPQIVCSKCADYFCGIGKDPVRVDCIAAIPIINSQPIIFIKYFLALIPNKSTDEEATKIIISFIDVLINQFQNEEICHTLIIMQNNIKNLK